MNGFNPFKEFGYPHGTPQSKAAVNGYRFAQAKLTARIADLERRNAMLVDTMESIAESSAAAIDSILRAKINRVLSAASAETEAWLQAEIVKRLGSPATYGLIEFNDAPYPDHVRLSQRVFPYKEWAHENINEVLANASVEECGWVRPPRVVPLYLDPENAAMLDKDPLATPEERKE